MKIFADYALAAILALVLCILLCSMWLFDIGFRRGVCTELCRPLKFDVDQKVNGGCLCIGSDKVLRIKDAP